MEKEKKALIISSLPKHSQFILNLFDELASKGQIFCLLSSKKQNDLSNSIKENVCSTKKIYFGPTKLNLINNIIFVLLFPFLVFKIFVLFSYYKYRQKISSIICLGAKEKMISYFGARILGIKTIWIEDVNRSFPKTFSGKIFKLFYKSFSRRVSIVVFSNKDFDHLIKIGVNNKSLNLVNCGAKINGSSWQVNIFSEISNGRTKNDLFTIGVVTPLDRKQKIETILGATKIALTISPKIRLIVVGEGKERKNLGWLAKKMEIDGHVWFVGPQGPVSKWFDNFDAFIVGDEKIKLANIDIILAAMVAGLPVLGPENSGLEDIMPEASRDLLVDMSSSEKLAQKIIELQQNKRLQEKIGKANKENVNKNLTIAQAVEKISKLV